MWFGGKFALSFGELAEETAEAHAVGSTN